MLPTRTPFAFRTITLGDDVSVYSTVIPIGDLELPLRAPSPEPEEIPDPHPALAQPMHPSMSVTIPSKTNITKAFLFMRFILLPVY